MFLFFRDRLVGWPREDKPTAASTGCSHLSSGQLDPNAWSILTPPQALLPDLRACKMLQIINFHFIIVAQPQRDSAAVALTQFGLRMHGTEGSPIPVHTVVSRRPPRQLTDHAIILRFRSGNIWATYAKTGRARGQKSVAAAPIPLARGASIHQFRDVSRG